MYESGCADTSCPTTGLALYSLVESLAGDKVDDLRADQRVSLGLLAMQVNGSRALAGKRLPHLAIEERVVTAGGGFVKRRCDTERWGCVPDRCQARRAEWLVPYRSISRPSCMGSTPFSNKRDSNGTTLSVVQTAISLHTVWPPALVRVLHRGEW